MNDSQRQAWREGCTAAQVDPDIVEHTATNYLAYRDFAANQKRGPIPLNEWFRWYAIENASELSAEKVRVVGCSVDESSVRPATPNYQRAIYEQLVAYVALRG